MLQVVLPLALVARTVHVDVRTETIRFVVDPVALVYVPIDVDEPSLPMRPVVPPLSLVAGAIGPDLYAIAVAEPPEPLALVGGARLEGVQGALLTRALRVILRVVRHCLAGLVQREVLRISLEIKFIWLDPLTRLVYFKKLKSFLAEYPRYKACNLMM